MAIWGTVDRPQYGPFLGFFFFFVFVFSFFGEGIFFQVDGVGWECDLFAGAGMVEDGGRVEPISARLLPCGTNRQVHLALGASMLHMGTKNDCSAPKSRGPLPCTVVPSRIR